MFKACMAIAALVMAAAGCAYQPFPGGSLRPPEQRSLSIDEVPKDIRDSFLGDFPGVQADRILYRSSDSGSSSWVFFWSDPISTTRACYARSSDTSDPERAFYCSESISLDVVPRELIDRINSQFGNDLVLHATKWTATWPHSNDTFERWRVAWVDQQGDERSASLEFMNGDEVEAMADYKGGPS